MTTNLTPVFTPNLMQKLLGRNYKWWYLINYSITRVRVGILGDFINKIGFITTTVLVIIVWQKSNPGIEIITYLLIGRTLRTLIDNFWYNRIGTLINTGGISANLLQPNSFFWREFVASAGERLIRNLLSFISMILVLIGFIYFGTRIIFDFNIIFVLLLLPVGFFINYCLVFLVGICSFFIRDKRDFMSYTETYNALSTVFIGSIIPLNQLPLKEFFQILPFSYILHHPMQIYLGKYSPLEKLYVFLGGIAWCVVLYFLAKLVFRIGLKRNESVGL